MVPLTGGAPSAGKVFTGVSCVCSVSQGDTHKLKPDTEEVLMHHQVAETRGLHSGLWQFGCAVTKRDSPAVEAAGAELRQE